MGFVMKLVKYYVSDNQIFLCKNQPQRLKRALFTWRNTCLVFVFLFTFTWLGCVLWSWDGVLALIPALAYSSGLGANLCVSCLYSQACLHTLFHLGLFWRPVKTQASGTNSVCEKSAHACLIITGHSPFLSLSHSLHRPLLWEEVPPCNPALLSPFWSMARKKGINI